MMISSVDGLEIDGMLWTWEEVESVLRQAQAELVALREDRDFWRDEYLKMKHERNEARAVARDAFSVLRERFWHTSIEDWEREWPWLKEK